MRFRELIEGSDDAKHQEQLEKTGFWGKRAAGCLFFAQDTKRFLFAHRSKDVESPHTWGTWGGAIDEGENPAEAAAREVQEEAGYKGLVNFIPLYVFSHSSGFKYYNFLAVIPKEFTPSMDWETQNFRWVQYGKWPTPLQDGCKELLNDPATKQKLEAINTK